jgi:hypothetical protein
MSSNKRAKERLIALYGPECFIEKLHLRPDDEPRHYTSKGQYKRMKQLTYHHIKEKSKGGKATVENGALLSAENHAWFHQQEPKAQSKMNSAFQEYKKCKVVLVEPEELQLPFKINAAIITPEDLMPDKKKHRRADVKRETQQLIKEYEMGEDDDDYYR